MPTFIDRVRRIFNGSPVHALRGDIGDILSSIREGFFILDRQWRCVYLNDAAARFLEIEREDLLGKNIWNECEQARDSRFFSEFSRAMEQDTYVQFEAWYPRLGRWYECRCHPRDDTLAVFFIDTTERRRTAEALEHLASRAQTAAEEARTLARIADENPEPVLRIAADYTVLYHNPASDEVCGYWGCRTGSVVPPDLRDIVDAALAAAAVTQHELTWQHRTYILTAAPYPADGYVNVYGHEITEQKRIQKSLAASEQRFRTLADNISQITWMADEAGNVTWFNRRWYEYTGSDPDQPPTEVWQKAHHPDHLLRVIQKVGFSVDTGEPLEDTFPVRAADGQYRWFLARTAPIRDATGRVSQWFGTATDIHDLRETQESLRESESRLSFVLENSPDRVYIQDLNLKYVWISRPAEGLRREDYIGRTDFDVFESEENAWKITKIKRRVIAQNRRNTVELALNIGGRDRIVEATYEPWRDPDGRVIGLAAFVRDITERKRAEQALRDSEQRLRAVLEVLPVGVFIADASGKITESNPAARNIWGGQTPLVEKPEEYERYVGWWRDSGKRVQAHEWGMARAIRGRESTGPDEIEIECFDGTRKTILNYATPICEESGVCRGGVAVTIDITDRKNAEQQLLELTGTLEQQVAWRTRQLGETIGQLQHLALELARTEDRERKRLAAILHDDLQQLLAGAKIHLNLVAGQVKDNAAAVEGLDQVKLLLGESIATSRGLSHELNPPALYEDGLPAAMETLAEQVRARHGLAVDVHADEEAEPRSGTVKAFLYRAAQEMLFNIVKHADVSEARLELRKSAEHLELIVSDKGKGFDPAVIEYGLGLHSIQERAQLLGGTLTVDSAPHDGATFALLIPDLEEPVARASDVSPAEKMAGEIAEAAKEHRPRSTPHPRSNDGPLRVLLVDDHKVMRDGLAAMMASESDIAVIGHADNGQAGLEKALDLHPDVVIMDVAMPVMDGPEATRRIKAALPGVRVVGLSMFERAYTAKQMYEAGAEAFLSKNAAAEKLLAAIRGTPGPESGTA